MNNAFPFVAQRLFNVPLAISPAKAEIVVAALAQRLGIGSFVRLDGTELAFGADEGDYADPGDAADDRAYDVVAGVAVIPIIGTLVHKLGSLRPYSGMTGYDGIRQNLLSALADDSVQAIALDIDSPGGEVSGCFDLADMIYQARQTKPIWAILTESAYSAAYALASAATRVVVPRTGGAGSIGVITMHVDFSRALDASGVKVTLITYGDRKADYADSEPLSAKALAAAQANVNAMGAIFDQLVARNRRLSAARVKSFQAGTFMGADAVAMGLADAVQPPDAAFRALVNSLSQEII